MPESLPYKIILGAESGKLQDKKEQWVKEIQLVFSTWGKRFCFADYAKGKFLGG